MAPALTTRAAAKLFFSAPSSLTGEQFQPVVQIGNVTSLADLNGQPRFQVALSDGQHVVNGVLVAPVSELFRSDNVKRFSVVQLLGYTIKAITGGKNKLVIIDNLKFFPDQTAFTKIGNPRSITVAIAAEEINEELASAGAPLALAPAPAAPRGPSDGFRSGREVIELSDDDDDDGAKNKGPVDQAKNKTGGENGGGPSHEVAAITTAGPAAVAPAGPPVMQRGKNSRGGFAVGGRGGRGGGRAGAGAKVDIDAAARPIESLTMYLPGTWSIRARVTHKSEIKTWKNARGEGRLFSVTLMDSTGKIKATGFNDACDNFFELLQEGRAYTISGVKISPAKKNFSKVNNEHELTFERATEIMLIEDDQDIQRVQYNTILLSKLDELEKDSVCDVLVGLTEVGELGSITAKATGNEIPKRELTVVDESGYRCQLSLWGKTAESFKVKAKSIIAFKEVKVGDFKGKTLSMSHASSMSVNPDLSEAHKLRAWFDNLEQDFVFKTHAPVKTDLSRTNETLFISEIEARRLGMNEKPDYFDLVATLSFIKVDKLSYPAHGNGCLKKVLQDGGSFKCGACDVEVEEPEHRYILNLVVEDHTGKLWLSAFNDAGLVLLEKTADEMERTKAEDASDLSAVRAILDKPKGKK